MTIRAGELRSVCAFERRAAAADSYGNVTNGSWAPLVTRRGWLKFGSSRERIEAGRMESAVMATLWLRADAATRGITAADRVTISGAVYAIRSVVEPPETGRIEMVVERGVAG